MSTLRARCPACRTLTAVALDQGYECHVCGRSSDAALVRVAGAFGAGGEAMADAARAVELPWPEAAVVAEPTLAAQTATVERVLPVLPVVLGGCCCAHLGAIRALATRHGRLAVVWFDAHGDLNTSETSPSGNAWGMPLRMAIDEGQVAVRDVAIVGARSLDPPEASFMAANGIDADIDRAVADTRAVYVAFDVDVLDPAAVDSFMPEPGGLTMADACRELGRVRVAGGPIVGVGFTGTVASSDGSALVRLAGSLGVQPFTTQ